MKAGSFLELFLGEREKTRDLKLNDYQVRFRWHVVWCKQESWG